MSTVPPSLHAALPMPWREALARQRIVLVGTRHPGNVGASARAMRAMGLERLVLAVPQTPGLAGEPQARALASGADRLLDTAVEYPSLAAAIAECTLAIAVSAEPREFGPPPLEPAEACALALAQPGPVAWVFGPERTGLSVADVGRCARLCSIPAEPGVQSLNLAQSVQVIAYVLRDTARRAAHAAAAAGESVHHGHPEQGAMGRGWATHAAVEGLHAHLGRALAAAGAIDPEHPKKLAERLRALLARTRLQAEEVDLLRGLLTRIERATGPLGRRRAGRQRPPR